MTSDDIINTLNPDKTLCVVTDEWVNLDNILCPLFEKDRDLTYKDKYHYCLTDCPKFEIITNSWQ